MVGPYQSHNDVREEGKKKRDEEKEGRGLTGWLANTQGLSVICQISS